MSKLGRLGACLVIAVLVGCAAEDEPNEPTEVGSNGTAGTSAPDPAAAASVAQSSGQPAAANAKCDPPYTVNQMGHKQYKPECL